MTRQLKRTAAGPASWSVPQEALEVGAGGDSAPAVFSITSAEVASSLNEVAVGVDMEVATFHADDVGVVSTLIGGFQITTVGCTFAAVAEKDQSPTFIANASGRPQKSNSAAASTVPGPALLPPATGGTRIRPPRDLIKLEDRLRWLLQPPLEQLLAANALTFAFTPFNFQ